MLAALQESLFQRQDLISQNIDREKEKNTLKKMGVLCVITITMICLSGCIVQSLNPFYTPDAVIETPIKNGAWERIDKNGKPEMGKPWLFENNKITVYDEKGLSGVVTVVYFRVEDTLFIDATADEPNHKICAWWAMNLAPVHTICRVETKDGDLILTPIDFDWIDKALKAKTFHLPYLKKEGWDSFLITAPSRDLMNFLKKNRQDNKLFSETHAIKFVFQNKP